MHKFNRAIIAHIGPMFGGKTSALLSDVRKMNIAGYTTALFKPQKDSRYSSNDVVNHDGEKLSAINIRTFKDIIDYIEKDKSEIKVIAIDEFQFVESLSEESKKKFIDGEITVSKFMDSNFSSSDFIKWIIDNQYTLIISGLDLDSDLKPFVNTKEILPYATHIFKHKAVCVCCGNDATTSFCTVEKTNRELIGGKDIYEPRCIKCYKQEF